MKSRAPGLLGVLLLIAPPAWAQGSAVSSVSIDHVSAWHSGRHRVWVSVLDGEGRPVTGLGTPDFRVESDGRRADQVEAEPFVRHYDASALTVLWDADLLARAGPEGARDLLRAVTEGAGERDRVRLRALGGSRRHVESRAERAVELAEDLRQATEPRREEGLYDVLFERVRHGARSPAGKSEAVLVVSRGEESGSRRSAVDVLAVAQARGRAVPVLVVLVEDQGAGREAERLARMAARSGGAVQRVSSAGGVPGAAARLVARLRGGYTLSFREEDFDAGAERHRVRVTVTAGGAQRGVERQLEGADILVAPWWGGPLPWVVLGTLLLLGGAAALMLRRRMLFRLVVESGEERGCSYEVFGLPVTVGAVEGNDLTLPDPRVSRNHAVLERRGRGVELLDLNSENGTFVNGDRITRRRLAPGDRVSLGGAVMLTFEARG
jgi:hypothetical protein